MCTSTLPRKVERTDFGRRIAGIETRQLAGVPLAGEHGAWKAPAQLERLVDVADRKHSRCAHVEGMRRDGEGTEHVDHHCDAARLPRAGHVIQYVNLHGVAPHAG